MAKPVAIFRGVDSGGGCPCVTIPFPLAPATGTVFAEKVAVMRNGNVLTPATGKTCTVPPAPCVSPRVVIASSKIFVNKAPIATRGNFLNTVTGITIPNGAATVFA